MLELVGLEKRYGTAVAVENVSLTIPTGQCVAILGPSGCGKTTTLRMIAGLVDATRGRISLNGRDITHEPAQRRNIGVVFQGYALFPHMTVAQNVAFGLEMRNVPRAEIEARVREALALVRLETYADRLPKNLSGGQQQRVALARAVVIRPDALLLDEPLSALDAKLRDEVRTEIRQLQQRLALTTVFVTHDQDEALSMADLVVVMNSGGIEQIGDPRSIYLRPATAFVASFMGRSNLLEGSVVAPGRFKATFGAEIPVRDHTDALTRMLTVRPESIVVARAAAALAEGGVSGTVRTVTYLGAVTRLEVEVGDAQRMSAEIASEDPDLASVAPGDPVVLSWKSDAVFPLPPV